MIPPTSVPGDHPILPRHSACLVCRKRKQRCDANKPECNECVSGNRQCRYEDDEYKTRTQILQSRIEELEAQIRALEEKQSTPGLSVQTSQSLLGGSQSPGHSSGQSSGLSPGLSPGSSRSPSSYGGTLSPTASSYNSIFSGQSSFSPTPPSSFGTEPDSPGSSWPSPDKTNKLLEIFFPRSAQCGFELHTGRVIQSLQPDASEPMIPVLLSAMLLMGCHFTQDPNLKVWESTLVERTKSELEENIARAHGGGRDQYNPLYHLQGMLMLGEYYFFKGRLLEGHVHVTNATRFAIALGMNKLNSRVFRRDKTPANVKRAFVIGVEPWSPRDSIELGEAINLWWTIVGWDMGGATLNGLPRSISYEDPEMTTVWPCPLSDFESGYPLPDDNYSYASLFDPEHNHIVADVSRDNIKSVMYKSYILMRYSIDLELERVSSPQIGEDWWARFEQCDFSADLFMRTMPPVRSARSAEELGGLVLIHTSIYCAVVQLHFASAEYELILGAQGHTSCIRPDGTLGGISYERCSEACRANALVAELVADLDASTMHMFLGIGWSCVSEILAADIPRLRQSGQLVQANEKERQWQAVETCMERIIATYPVIELQLKQLRAMKRDQILKLQGTGSAYVS